MGPTTCPFCLMLASRGFVYLSEESAGDFDRFHRHCDCRIVPGTADTKVDGYDPAELYDRWKHPEKYADETAERMTPRQQLEAEARRVYIANGGGMGLSEAEAAERFDLLVDGNTDAQLRGYIEKHGGAVEGRERERVYGVPYEDAMVVEPELLDSESFESKFNGISDDPEVDAKLLEGAKHALERNSGKKTESMTLVDIFAYDSVTVDCDIDYGIVYNDEIREFIAARKDGPARIAAIHNHPNGMPPSLDDFSKAAENNYAIGVVVGHNGQVYTYGNFGKVYSTEECDNYNDLIVLYLRGGGDIDRICTEVFASEGLIYELK
ncbi:MAG: hypothetical protein IJ734_07000 [Fibrobacter sp.]|nr:hypothetical protein [Fibrobacter sp.]